MRAIVSEVGPLGACYRVFGDGRRMSFSEFDPMGFWAFDGALQDVAALRALGYTPIESLWPQPRGA